MKVGWRQPKHLIKSMHIMFLANWIAGGRGEHPMRKPSEAFHA
ncbi:hypothetical protein [Geobacillus subterraneus]|nr:hypothetical protein [Geobacillus subterraneus]